MSRSLQFESEKEKLARKRQKELLDSPKKLGDKIPQCKDDDLDSLTTEAALHLGNVYFCEAMPPDLAVGADPDFLMALKGKHLLSKARHEELMAIAGKLLAKIRR